MCFQRKQKIYKLPYLRYSHPMISHSPIKMCHSKMTDVPFTFLEHPQKYTVPKFMWSHQSSAFHLM